MILITRAYNSEIERKRQSLLFDLFNAFDEIESCNRLYFSSKRPIFFHMCATCSGLLSDISTMVNGLLWIRPQ